MSTIKVAIATNSLGKSAAGHTIHRKLEAAKYHRFDGVEVAFECLDAHAATFTSLATRSEKLRAAASDVYSKADSISLSLIALNPFRDYDGLKSTQEVDARLQEAELWCQLCQIMRIPIFQVSSLHDLSNIQI
jgi:4-hydroxyphenylpyruvate dioxygenase